MSKAKKIAKTLQGEFEIIESFPEHSFTTAGSNYNAVSAIGVDKEGNLVLLVAYDMAIGDGITHFVSALNYFDTE